MTREALTNRPNIAFAGLTAAGKTTHAKILAQELGYQYISATDIILDIINFKGTNSDRAWLDHYDTIEKAREGDGVDIELEARITAMANEQDGLVLDTWAMAWIYSGPTSMVRIWIESDQPSRTRKCYVSQGVYKTLTLDGCRQLIDQKDGDTRTKFQRRLGFDLFSDRHRYDVVLDNGRLIPDATEKSAQKGIATFAPILLATTQHCIDQLVTPDFDPSHEIAHTIIESSKGMIARIGNTYNA